MANIKSAKKRIKQDIKKRARNKERKVAILKASKVLIKLLKNHDKKPEKVEACLPAYSEYCKTLDKAVKRGIIHKNKANRKKSDYSARLSA